MTWRAISARPYPAVYCPATTSFHGATVATCQEGHSEQAPEPISEHDLPGTFRVNAHTEARTRFDDLTSVIQNKHPSRYRSRHTGHLQGEG